MWKRESLGGQRFGVTTEEVAIIDDWRRPVVKRHETVERVTIAIDDACGTIQ